jgi:hypothetical protein
MYLLDCESDRSLKSLTLTFMLTKTYKEVDWLKCFPMFHASSPPFFDHPHLSQQSCAWGMEWLCRCVTLTFFLGHGIIKSLTSSHIFVGPFSWYLGVYWTSLIRQTRKGVAHLLEEMCGSLAGVNLTVVYIHLSMRSGRQNDWVENLWRSYLEVNSKISGTQLPKHEAWQCKVIEFDVC